jgi:hypothetical protein
MNVTCSGNGTKDVVECKECRNCKIGQYIQEQCEGSSDKDIQTCTNCTTDGFYYFTKPCTGTNTVNDAETAACSCTDKNCVVDIACSDGKNNPTCIYPKSRDPCTQTTTQPIQISSTTSTSNNIQTPQPVEIIDTPQPVTINDVSIVPTESGNSTVVIVVSIIGALCAIGIIVAVALFHYYHKASVPVRPSQPDKQPRNLFEGVELLINVKNY